MNDVCIESYRLDLSSDQCGYPICCPGNQPKFIPPAFPNSYIDGHLGMWPELKEFMSDAAEIFRVTGMPMCPCIAHHFCIPFSPVCAMLYFAKKRKRELDELLQTWNEENGLAKGVYLQWNQDYITAASMD